MELFLETWRPGIRDLEAHFLIPAALLASFLLGWLSYTDLFQNKSVPNTGSMGLLFIAFALFPFLYANTKEHIFWALGFSFFFIVIFLVGAIADGDMKLYLAFSWLLGPAALLAALFSWAIVLLYSLPIIFHSLKTKEKRKRGQRLGAAPAVPGIALSLPLTLALLGLDIVYVGLMLLGMIVSFLLSLLLYTIDSKAKEAEDLDITAKE